MFTMLSVKSDQTTHTILMKQISLEFLSMQAPKNRDSNVLTTIGLVVMKPSTIIHVSSQEER